jgi:hypothetical protein
MLIQIPWTLARDGRHGDEMEIIGSLYGQYECGDGHTDSVTNIEFRVAATNGALRLSPEEMKEAELNLLNEGREIGYSDNWVPDDDDRDYNYIEFTDDEYAASMGYVERDYDDYEACLDYLCPEDKY